MIHLFISLSLGTAVFFGLYFVAHWGFAVAGALVTIMVANYLLGRRVNKAITALMEQVAVDIKNGKLDRAIHSLEGGLKYSRYQFFIKSQLMAQIGVIHYIKRDFNAAFSYLQKAFARHWIAQGMLGVIYMRRKDRESMVKTFNRAVRYNSKEGLLWNLYAYCQLRLGDRDGAIQTLVRASKKLPSDEKIRNNLINLQNNRKMKMKHYGEMWLQFHLEKMPGGLGGRRPPYPATQRKRIIRR